MLPLCISAFGLYLVCLFTLLMTFSDQSLLTVSVLCVCMILGQSNLLKSSVLVIGAGGLGSPALLYLAACGVGMFLVSYLQSI